MKPITIRSQVGVASVELALVGTAVFMSAYMLLLLPHYVWQYNVLHDTAAHAARFLALQSPVAFDTRSAIAQKMIEETAASAGIKVSLMQVSCPDGQFGRCDSAAARTVLVEIAAPSPLGDDEIYTRASARFVR
jgi:hypothetical protein